MEILENICQNFASKRNITLSVEGKLKSGENDIYFVVYSSEENKETLTIKRGEQSEFKMSYNSNNIVLALNIAADSLPGYLSYLNNSESKLSKQVIKKFEPRVTEENPPSHYLSEKFIGFNPQDTITFLNDFYLAV